MKIGIVCYPTFGGSGVLATELGIGLAKNGHDVHFITYNQPARLDLFSPRLFYHEVSVANYPLFDYAPYEVALASKLVDVVRCAKLDLLHVHYAIPHASAAYMAKQILATMGISIPVITTLHGTDITLVGKDPIYQPVATFSINQSDGVTAVSNYLKKATYDHFEITKDIRVIHNFVAIDRFKFHEKNHFKLALAPNGERIIVHASNFRQVKRTLDVVKIFAKIKKEIPAKLLMVGDGPERADCTQLCRKLNVYDDVRFLGNQDAIEEILAICDLFLMPSESESFGLAALEAMACKVPVVSSDTGGIPELNLHGVSGYLSKVGDIDDMAKNSLTILKNDNTLKKFKENAYEIAHRFDLKHILPIYENYYQEIINHKS